MRIITILITLCLSWTALALDLPPGIPRSLTEFRQKHPYSHPHPTTRKQVHLRPSANSTDDISSQFLSALHQANNGGTLVLPAKQTFVIGQPLDLTFLSNIHILLDGEILFTNDTAYWQKNAFRHPFQNSIMFWKWGGKDIKIYGNGVLNGNGQRWWNEFSGLEILDPSNTYLRPILFYAENLTNFEMRGIHLKDSPCWTAFFVDAQHITLSDVACTAVSTNPAKAPPKNSDFFDSLNVSHVNIQRAWVDIGDDCFSPKSNNTDLVVRDMYCNGTHGISMGSIGQYPGEMSFIKDVHVENMWMLNGQHGARIKSWAGENVGYGFVDNITFRGFWNGGNEYTAFIDSCYFNINATTCAAYPSRVNITNVLFDNFTGTSSGKYGNAVARLTCSPNAVCKNIRFRNFNVTSPCGGPPVVICDGISEDMGIPCVSSTSAAATAALKKTCSSGLATLPTRLPWGSVP